MKKLFKIATAGALVMLSANAVATEATGTFVWAGNIPAASVEGDIKILDTGAVGHLAGQMQFAELSTAGQYEITSSDELVFDVVQAEGGAHVDYTYTVETIRFSLGNGLLATDNNVQFEVIADGVAVANNVTSGDITGETILTLGSTTDGFTAEGGDSVTVQAIVLVADGI